MNNNDNNDNKDNKDIINNNDGENTVTITITSNGKLNKKFFWIIVPIWALIVLVNIFMPMQTFSETENRNLKAFPEFSAAKFFDAISIDSMFMKDVDIDISNNANLVSLDYTKQYMQDIETFVNDHFAFRDRWVYGQGIVEFCMGSRESNGIYLSRDGLVKNLPDPDEKTVENNISGLKHISDKFGVPSYIIIVPSSAVVKKDKLPWFAYTWNQEQFIADTYREIGDSAVGIDVVTPILEHKNEYIYYRTDHHWTTDGAYLAYIEFCRARGIQPKENTDAVISDSFYGTYYSGCGFRFTSPDTMKAIPDIKNITLTLPGNTQKDSIYFDEYLDKKDKYSYFTGPLESIINIKTDNTNGKRLLVFKDSYFHCFLPYILDEYSEITMVDLRILPDTNINILNVGGQYDISKYDEILYLYNTDVFTHEKNIYKLQLVR